MYRLNEGILLEDLDVVLPWGEHMDSLKNIASPVISESSADRVKLYWNGHSLFGGLEGQLQMVFFHNSSPGYRDPNNGYVFRMASFSPQGAFQNPRRLFSQLHDHFLGTLGSPTQYNSDYKGYGFPLAEWDAESFLFVLMLFERFGGYCHVEIWRKPVPEWRKT